MKQAEVLQLRNEADKAIGRAQVLISKAAHNCDPAVNAELQHSIQYGLRDLSKAAELLQPVRGIVAELASELYDLKAEEEKVGA